MRDASGERQGIYYVASRSRDPPKGRNQSTGAGSVVGSCPSRVTAQQAARRTASNTKPSSRPDGRAAGFVERARRASPGGRNETGKMPGPSPASPSSVPCGRASTHDPPTRACRPRKGNAARHTGGYVRCACLVVVSVLRRRPPTVVSLLRESSSARLPEPVTMLPNHHHRLPHETRVRREVARLVASSCAGAR